MVVLGPYIAVLKTHIDIVSDFREATIEGLGYLAKKHNFLIFEDRKFIDIGNTVQKQYRGGIFRISEWAHIVNASVLAGPGIIEALDQSMNNSTDRGMLILAEMTSKGSLATGEYTRASVSIANQFPKSVIGFIATKRLSDESPEVDKEGESTNEAQSEAPDFVTFTTGVNMSTSGDALGQQYQTPASAMAGGSDFLIAGRGIYASQDPIASAKEYRQVGWEAYLKSMSGA